MPSLGVLTNDTGESNIPIKIAFAWVVGELTPTTDGIFGDYQAIRSTMPSLSFLAIITGESNIPIKIAFAWVSRTPQCTNTNNGWN